MPEYINDVGHDEYKRYGEKMTYDLNTPHPGFGKDPNIKNEFGHTHYPKWVENKEKKRVLVNNPKEEMEAPALCLHKQ